MTTHVRTLSFAFAAAWLAAASLTAAARAADAPPQAAEGCDYCGSFADPAGEGQVTSAYEPLSGYKAEMAHAVTENIVALGTIATGEASCASSSVCGGGKSR